MRTTCTRLAWLLATAATTTMLAYSSCAAAASSTSSDGSTPDSAPVSDVIVTAQKRSESLLKVAAPVTSLSAATLARQGDIQLTDYAATVPGLNLITSQPGQTVVIMRGITTGFGAAIPATTSTYVDDVPYGSSTASAYGSIATLDLDPATLQRIEVLRGPQGTLYGASALGGLIKYVTAPPSLTNYSGRVEVDASSVDGGGQGGGVRAMIGGPLIEDKLGFSLSAFDRIDPGFIDDPHRNLKNVNESRVDGGRFAALWRPSSQFSLKFSVIAQDTYTDGTSEADLSTNLTPIYGKYQQVRYGNEVWNFRNVEYSLSADYNFGWADLTSITSYSTRNARYNIDFTNKFGSLLSGIVGTPNLAVFDDITLDSNKTTQEFRLASPDSDKLDWLVGFFFTHEHSVKPEAFNNPFSTTTGTVVPVAAGVFTDTLTDNYSEYAGYADLTYHFTSKFKILAGLRYGSDSETGITPFSGILFGPPTVAVGKSSDTSLTYLVSPSYNLDDHNMVYIRIASGFRPGGPTGVAPSDLIAGAPETYAPDTLTNYEVGYKASFPYLRMTVDLSGYDIEWHHIQVLTDVGGFFVTGNGANARSTGAEFAWTWQPMTGLSLSANAAYTDAYLTADAPAIGGISGENLPDVPKFTANLSADYDFIITNDVNGFVGGSFQYMGSRPIDYISGTPLGYVPPVMRAYNTANLHAGFSRAGFTVEAFIKNVGDSYGLTRLVSEVRDGYDAPLGGSVIQPRTFGVSISNKF